MTPSHVPVLAAVLFEMIVPYSGETVVYFTVGVRGHVSMDDE